MSINDVIKEVAAGIVKPIASLIDKLHTSDDERGRLRNALAETEANVARKILDYQAKVLELEAEVTRAQTQAIVAEAQGESWLQRTWRPGMMVLFGIVVANNLVLAPYVKILSGVDLSLAITAGAVPDKVWSIIELGIGGYIASRGVEKVARTLAAGGGVKNVLSMK